MTTISFAAQLGWKTEMIFLFQQVNLIDSKKLAIAPAKQMLLLEKVAQELLIELGDVIVEMVAEIVIAPKTKKLRTAFQLKTSLA